MSTVKEYIKQISFRLVQPQTKLPPGYGSVRKAFGRAGISLDVLNTRLPEQDQKIINLLLELCKIPRMSTIAISAIINRIVANLPLGQAFLNIGVWNGYTFLSGMGNNPDKTCIGVDNFSNHGGPRREFLERFNRMKSSNHHFYDMDYEEYFAKVHRERIGFYIFDGPHSYEHQLKNLEIVEPFLEPNCVILIDDTNSDGPMRGTKEFLEARRGKYEILIDQTTSRNGHPTYWNGLLLFQKLC
jgi:hypothetical protein